MSNNAQQNMTTNTLGFFNPNRWPIQLVISKFNCTLHLQPGEFILDKQGRKINDPFFEAYAKTKQLAKELSKELVPVLYVPVAAPQVPASQRDGQSVRSVTEFKTDAKGHRQPVIPAPKILPEQSISKSSVIPMTMEEAKAAGFIGKQRIVPEDYGVTDTEGMPPSNPPPLRVSVDSTMNKNVKPLPKELLKEVPDDRKTIVQALQTSTSTDIESIGFMNTTTPHAPANVQMHAGPANLPNTVIEEAVPEVDAPPAEDVDDFPVPRLPQNIKSVTARDRYSCQVCGKAFQFRSQLVNHVKQTTSHAGMMEIVMADYPAPEGQA